MKHTNQAKPLRAGQLWEFPLDADGCLGWVVARAASEGGRERALVVPADSAEVLGPGDQAVALVSSVGAMGSTVVAERAVLRTGAARWVAREDLWFMTPVALAAPFATALAAAFEGAAEAVAGGPVAGPHGAEVLPGLAAAARLERWLARERSVVRLVGGALGGDDEGELDEPGYARPLAAASHDPLGSLVAEAGAGEGQRFRVEGLEGRTWTLEVEQGEFVIDAYASPGAGRPARLIQLGAGGGRRFVAGSPRLSGGWRSAWLPCSPVGERLIVEADDPDARLAEVNWTWPS